MLKNRKMILKTLKPMPLFLVTVFMLTVAGCAKNDGGGSGGGSSSAPVNVTDVTLAPASISTVTGKQWTLSATVSPANATDKSVTWESSDESVATVQPDASTTAQVTTVKKGTTTITVTTNDGAKEATATINVIDPVAVSSVSVGSQTIANKNKTVEIPIVINPTNTTYADITCTSSDPTVFTVTADKDKKVCKVTTVDYGTGSRSATLTAKVTDEGGKTRNGYATITVRKPVDVTSVSLASTSVVIEGRNISKDVPVTIQPSGADIEQIQCSSSNSQVFTVVANTAAKKCVVTSKGGGTANLTVKVTDVTGNTFTKSKPVQVLIEATAIILTRKSDGKILSSTDEVILKGRQPVTVGTAADSDIVVSFTPSDAYETLQAPSGYNKKLLSDSANGTSDCYYGVTATSITGGWKTKLDYSKTLLQHNSSCYLNFETKKSTIVRSLHLRANIPVENIEFEFDFPTMTSNYTREIYYNAYWPNQSQYNFYWLKGGIKKYKPIPGNENVTFTNLTPAIISLDSSKKITALSEGEAKIRVTTQEGNKTAIAKIRVYKPKKVYTVGGVNFTMVRLPTGGKYKWPYGKDTSGPTEMKLWTHYLSESEVTWELWQKVKTWAASKGYVFDSANLAKKGGGTNPQNSDQQPVTNVSFCDIAVFSNALTAYYNKQTGSQLKPGYLYKLEPPGTPGSYKYELKDATSIANCKSTLGSLNQKDNGFNLPDYQAWEGFARWQGETDLGNSITITQRPSIPTFYWTKIASAAGASAGYNNAAANKEVAWYVDNSSNASHPVKGKNPTALGLYDMSGNVAELIDPIADATCQVRAGSYKSSGTSIGMGKYETILRTTRREDVGFRISRTADW